MSKSQFLAGYWSHDIFVILKIFKSLESAEKWIFKHEGSFDNDIDSFDIIEVAYG